MRRTRDLDAMRNPPGGVHDAERAAVERGSEYEPPPLLDVVGADRHGRATNDAPAVERVDMERAVGTLEP